MSACSTRAVAADGKCTPTTSLLPRSWCTTNILVGRAIIILAEAEERPAVCSDIQETTQPRDTTIESDKCGDNTFQAPQHPLESLSVEQCRLLFVARLPEKQSSGTACRNPGKNWTSGCCQYDTTNSPSRAKQPTDITAAGQL